MRSMFPCAGLLFAGWLMLHLGAASYHADDAPTADVVRDEVPGSINHSPDMVWGRVSGPAEVIDSRTLLFADGTRVSLYLVSPELQQRGRMDGEYYPAGQEAADFLSELIGNQIVTCYIGDEEFVIAYVGDTNIGDAMIVNGWSLANHSSKHPAEIIARENKRGLWRGEFVNPDDWREGTRLPGEGE